MALNIENDMIRLSNFRPISVAYIRDMVPTIRDPSFMVNLHPNDSGTVSLSDVVVGQLYASLTTNHNLVGIYEVVQNDGFSAVTLLRDIVNTEFACTFEPDILEEDVNNRDFMIICEKKINTRLTMLSEMIGEQLGLHLINSHLNMFAGRFKRFREYIWEGEKDFVLLRACRVVKSICDEVAHYTGGAVDMSKFSMDISSLFYGNQLRAYKDTAWAYNYWMENENMLVNRSIEWLKE